MAERYHISYPNKELRYISHGQRHGQMDPAGVAVMRDFKVKTMELTRLLGLLVTKPTEKIKGRCGRSRFDLHMGALELHLRLDSKARAKQRCRKVQSLFEGGRGLLAAEEAGQARPAVHPPIGTADLSSRVIASRHSLGFRAPAWTVLRDQPRVLFN